MYWQKASKRKKIHAFKSKVRSEQLEVAQNKRQNAWQQFQSTKGKTKKVKNNQDFICHIWLLFWRAGFDTTVKLLLCDLKD